jgi:hypothetical protein
MDDLSPQTPSRKLRLELRPLPGVRVHPNHAVTHSNGTEDGSKANATPRALDGMHSLSRHVNVAAGQTWPISPTSHVLQPRNRLQPLENAPKPGGHMHDRLPGQKHASWNEVNLERHISRDHHLDHTAEEEDSLRHDLHEVRALIFIIFLKFAVSTTCWLRNSPEFHDTVA